MKQIRHIPTKYFKVIHILGKFVGVVFIVYGVILAIQGLSLSLSLYRMFPLIIGFALGGFVFYTGERAGEFIESGKSDVAAIDEMCKFISWFLISLGLLILLFIVSYILYLLL